MHAHLYLNNDDASIHALLHLDNGDAGRSSGAALRLLFEADLYPRTETAAKLIVYMLRPPTGPSGAAENGQAGEGAGESRPEALGNLAQLARLLEQYYHPSNNGA